jgi:hypothetical protein
MAEELKNMMGASPVAFTPFSQARGAEAIRGFGSGMAPKISPPQSVFSGSPQQYASQLPAPPSRSSNLFSTIAPTFPSRLAQPVEIPPIDLLSTPPMAPVTDTITLFGSPMASRTERIVSPYGTTSTTLTPEQQVQRAQARQQAQEMGTMPRTPEQQQALLAQIRGGGAGRAKDSARQQEQFFAQKRAESRGARRPQATPFLPTQQAAPNLLAGTGFGQMQRLAGQSPALRGPLANPMDSFGGGMMVAGGPQPQDGAGRRRQMKASGVQNTQPSWSNYVGNRPIQRNVGTQFYRNSPRYS